jgi:hypothetical protein
MFYLAMAAMALSAIIIYLQVLNARSIENLQEAVDDLALRQANIRKGELSKRMERILENEGETIKVIPIRRGRMEIRREI